MLKTSINKQGFTLIEMSIVVVIVAIIIAGVISGQEILEGTKRMSVVSTLSQYKSAYEQFENKYYSVPGDIVDATDVWDNTEGDGDGDGEIERGGDNEDYLAWQHLALSGFIDGSYLGSMSGTNVELETEIPKGPYINSGYRMIAESEKITSTVNAVTFGKKRSGHNVDNSILSPRQAKSIDEKIDDTNPSEGNFVVIEGNDASAASDCYVVNSAGDEDDEYALTNDNKTCVLIYYMENVNT